MMRATALLLLTLLLAGCALCDIKSAGPRVYPNEHQIEVGLCEDFPASSRTSSNVRSDVDFIERAGCTVLRVGLPWDAIEASPKQFNWTFWDQLVDQANARGVRLIPYLCYTPKWASSRSNQDDYWRWPPADSQSFANFARAAAEHFRGRIQSWELWNEPDNADYWRGSVDQYAELVRAGSRAIRAVDPHLQIVLGGISWNLDYLKVLLRDQHIGDCVSIVNLHAYFETWIPGSIEQVGEEINRASDLISRYGANQQIWLAETGYSDHRKASHVSDAYDTVYAYEHTTDYQAQALLRTVVSAAATDHVSLVAWYRVNDLPADETVIGDVNNRFLGLRKIGGQLKPDALAMHLAASILRGNIADLDASCSVSRPLRSNSIAHVFRRQDRHLFLVAWLQTDVSGAFANTDRSGNSADIRAEDLCVTIPIHCKMLTCTDATEKALPLPPIRNTCQSTSLYLRLNGGCTFVVELQAD